MRNRITIQRRITARASYYTQLRSLEPSSEMTLHVSEAVRSIVRMSLYHPSMYSRFGHKCWQLHSPRRIATAGFGQGAYTRLLSWRPLTAARQIKKWYIFFQRVINMVWQALFRLHWLTYSSNACIFVTGFTLSRVPLSLGAKDQMTTSRVDIYSGRYLYAWISQINRKKWGVTNDAFLRKYCAESSLRKAHRYRITRNNSVQTLA